MIGAKDLVAFDDLALRHHSVAGPPDSNEG
jgi:hypothetical protein